MIFKSPVSIMIFSLVVLWIPERGTLKPATIIAEFSASPFDSIFT